MSTYLPVELRRLLETADDHQCAYCQTTQGNTGQPMVLDHIVPEMKGGKTEFANLCFACRRCNEFKGSTTHLQDLVTEEIVPLFNPRQQKWSDHFAWDGQGIHLVGLSPVGRVTVIALNMNNELIIDSRRRWASVGWHPPT
jgi:5-methylcytosine-specific restriction endonuclease McrA